MKRSKNYPKTNNLVRQLYPSEIREIHRQVLLKDGGLEGELQPGMIDYICEKPFHEYFGEDRYPTIFEKASVTFSGIATGHFFADGNKRTAVMSTYVFLAKNGYEIDCSQEELYEVALGVTNKLITDEELADWLLDNCITLDTEL